MGNITNFVKMETQYFTQTISFIYLQGRTPLILFILELKTGVFHIIFKYEKHQNFCENGKVEIC